MREDLIGGFGELEMVVQQGMATVRKEQHRQQVRRVVKGGLNTLLSSAQRMAACPQSMTNGSTVWFPTMVLGCIDWLLYDWLCIMDSTSAIPILRS